MLGLLCLTSALALACPQDSNVQVPSSVMDFVGSVLPEKSNAGAAFVTDAYDPNLVVTELCAVSVVFLWEGAGYRNSMGYFTYEEKADGSVEVLSAELVIQDASFPPQGSLATGDLFQLRGSDGEVRLFEPGERVGFFLIANGWNAEPAVRDWSLAGGMIPSQGPSGNAGIGLGCYTSINKLNPEYASGAADSPRHLALVRVPGSPGFLGGGPLLIAGFEDLNRLGGSDDDFNDLVFLVTATPETSIAETPAFPFAPGDGDGDGILGVEDHYPDDAERAYRTRYPAFGSTVLGVEDLYPAIGDADYNDCVFAYDFEVVTDSAGRTKDLMGTLHLVARGAGYDHSVGIRIAGVPPAATGALQIERFLGASQTPETDLRSITDFHGAGQRIVDLFPSTKSALPPLPGVTHTNTLSSALERPASSVRFRMTFDDPVDSAVLGRPPYDLYVEVHRGAERYDIHFPGFDGFTDRPSGLPTETGEDSFLGANGRPWLLEIPTSWRFPLERVPIWQAYPDFDAWAAAQGGTQADWYDRPVASGGLVSSELQEYVPGRSWSLDLQDSQ